MMTQKNIIFDLDSTLVTIEGVDELARMNDVYDEVSALTAAAMNGTGSFEEVFSARLNHIKPTYQQLCALSDLYKEALTPGAGQLITYLHSHNVGVFCISSGYNPAVSETLQFLGVPLTNIFANQLRFNSDGTFLDFDRSIPLWRDDGKTEVIQLLQQKHGGGWYLVGDSVGDAKAAKKAGAQFICFTGVVKRPMAVDEATIVIDDLHRIYQDPSVMLGGF